MKEERYTITARNADDMSGEHSLAFQAKRERVKQSLLSLLPPFEKLQKIFERNGDWWHTWRLKCSGTSLPGQTLAQFAERAIRDGNIGALGTVVLSLGICLAEDGDVEQYIEAVDRYVLSEDEYAATIEGMECLILKSKWFADIGQPRRAWITYRKGLMYAQLMVSLFFRIILEWTLTLERVFIAKGQAQQRMKACGGRSITATASYLSFSVFPTVSSTATAISRCRTWATASTSHHSSS